MSCNHNISNYFDVAPAIGNQPPYQHTPESKPDRTKEASSSSSFLSLKDKPFWIWDQQEHLEKAEETDGNCCFNHIVGLPS